MYLKYFSLTILVFTLILLSCQKESQEVLIDEELTPFIESFQYEASLRSVSVNADGLQAVFDNFTTNIAGQCQRTGDDLRKIAISKAYWRTANEYEKEFIIFHELGHCILGREHLDGVDARGQCQSIMHSGLTNCTNAYNAINREIYLDELFK